TWTNPSQGEVENNQGVDPYTIRNGSSLSWGNTSTTTITAGNTVPAGGGYGTGMGTNSTSIQTSHVDNGADSTSSSDQTNSTDTRAGFSPSNTEAASATNHDNTVRSFTGADQYGDQVTTVI